MSAYTDRAATIAAPRIILTADDLTAMGGTVVPLIADDRDDLRLAHTITMIGA